MSVETRTGDLPEVKEGPDIYEGFLKRSCRQGVTEPGDWYRREGAVVANGHVYGFAFQKEDGEIRFGYEISRDDSVPCMRDIEADELFNDELPETVEELRTLLE